MVFEKINGILEVKKQKPETEKVYIVHSFEGVECMYTIDS